MTALPPVAPDVVADAVDALPGRLRRKLDDVLPEARGWPVTETPDGYAVHADGGAVVSLARVVTAAGDLRCDCLLAPRCLHRAAIASLAPTAEPAPEPATEPEPGAAESAPEPAAADPAAKPESKPQPAAEPAAKPEPTPEPAAEQAAEREPAPQPAAEHEPGPEPAPVPAAPELATKPEPKPKPKPTPKNQPTETQPAASQPTETQPTAAGTPVTPAQRAAAKALWDAACGVVDTGIPGAGAVPQAALLRAAHQARAVKLPRAAAAAVRVVEHLRAARRGDPAFRLGELRAALRELLSVSRGLLAGKPWQGVARREYHDVGARRLFGLCCAPIVTASGYAGAVTYLVDEGGGCWQVSDVTPGDVALAVLKPGSPISVGEARLTFSELGRAGLRTADLRAASDGRISTGSGTQAIGAAGVAWTEEPLDALWTPSPTDQLRRYHRALDLPILDRPAGHDLAFLTGFLAGAASALPATRDAGDGVLLATESATLVIVPAHDSPHLPYVENLRLLASTTGAPIRLVGRFAGGRRVEGLAVAAPWLPASYGGHADLGVDRLRRSDLPPPEEVEPPDAGTVEAPPLFLLGRRVERAIEGGRSAVPGDVHDGDRLRAVALPSAADLVDRLEAACRVTRDAFGRASVPGGRRTDDLTPLAEAWLAADVYLTAAARSLQCEEWSMST